MLVLDFFEKVSSKDNSELEGGRWYWLDSAHIGGGAQKDIIAFFHTYERFLHPIAYVL